MSQSLRMCPYPPSDRKNPKLTDISLIVTTMLGLFSRSRKVTTVFLCASRLPTLISQACPEQERRFPALLLSGVIILLHCPCYGASTKPMGLSPSFTLTVICKLNYNFPRLLRIDKVMRTGLWLIFLQRHLEAQGLRRLAQPSRRHQPWYLLLPRCYGGLAEKRHQYSRWYPHYSLRSFRLRERRLLWF